MRDYVDVTCLEPPFAPGDMEIEFEAFSKVLAISAEDWKKLSEMFSAVPIEGRMVELAPLPSPDKRVRIRVVKS